MPLRRRRGERPPVRTDDESTPELTGDDARPSEAALGSAGNGASPFGADLTGGVRELEDSPHPEDILPDHIERLAGAPADDDLAVTARPNDRPEPLDEHLEHAPSDDEEDRPDIGTPTDRLA